MVKRTLLVLAAFALAMVGLVPAASANEGSVGIEGTGTLWARGSGTVVIDGGGIVRMAIDGDVTIVDRGGDARVWITGRSGVEEEMANTATYELTGFHGRLRVKGTDFEISADGRMRFRATGRGTVFLRGTGVYRTRHEFGHWTDAGVRLELGAEIIAL